MKAALKQHELHDFIQHSTQIIGKLQYQKRLSMTKNVETFFFWSRTKWGKSEIFRQAFSNEFSVAKIGSCLLACIDTFKTESLKVGPSPETESATAKESTTLPNRPVPRERRRLAHGGHSKRERLPRVARFWGGLQIGNPESIPSKLPFL